ncbi:serine/threonine protein kinase [Gandjariella thermophila]|uniref:non-specific serine/threonine protein kinase n=2 Tax=Gandjariella thermophila TaxID=1931992 RepID=A0A4D4J4U3_9PSEU|nr:serine/threonine protein kinase [Gandjariella thermophila]
MATASDLFGPQPPGAGDSLLAEQVRRVLWRHGAGGWTERADDFWFFVEPPGHRQRRQGWKLHVSATPLSAVLVTRRAAEVLVAEACAFKVARGLPQVAELVSVNAARAWSGKVVTAYPDDDEHFARLAERLHRATEHLPGPTILSDRPYRPGSLVHYRFGAFAGYPVLGNDGRHESRLRAPDGRLVPDHHRPWFDPPGWADCPLGGTAPDPRPPTPSAEPVLLADRFVVGEAIRHGNKGGVYRGVDRDTGEPVVIKQARPHVGALLDGTDARDLLRHEAALLRRLAPHGVTPRPLGLFEQDGHLFLAQERVEGTSLFAWVHQRIAHAQAAGQPSIPLAEVLPMARRLVATIATLHAEGLVIRDLSPTNLMVTPGGAVRLVDLEFAAVPGTPAPVAGTPGYAAPEQLDPPGAAVGITPVPGPAADRYSLGALLLFLTSGADPALAPDRPARRPGQDRLTRLVRRVAASNPATRALGVTIRGLLADDPDRRWTLEQVRDALARPHRPSLLPEPDRLPAPAQDALLTDGLDFLVDTMSPGTGDRLWPAPEPYADHDPRAVQCGAAGVLAVLTRATAVRDDPRLARAVRRAATWLDRRLRTGDRLLPGLYFGASGALWALFEAAGTLGDPALADSALRMARRIPPRWPNPDVCHGAAGAGLALLHLWRATGDAELGTRVRDCADGLRAAAARRDGQVRWPIPAGFDSALAGATHYGFAHGVAGVGAFLLAAARSLDDDRCLDLSREAGETLCTVARREGAAAWWPTGEEPDATAADRLPHWCSGSSGVGTFLARLWQATGVDRYREWAEAAACAVRGSRWRTGTATCHGLPGDGEFLLDLAGALGEPRYRDWAEELAACLDVRAVLRDGYRLVPDESGTGVSAGYATGLAGVLSFLLRLRHGGPRPWMVDTGEWWHTGRRPAHAAAADRTTPPPGTAPATSTRTPLEVTHDDT